MKEEIVMEVVSYAPDYNELISIIRAKPEDKSLMTNKPLKITKTYGIKDDLTK